MTLPCHLRYVIALVQALVYPAGKLRVGLTVSRGPSNLRLRILESRWNCPYGAQCSRSGERLQVLPLALHGCTRQAQAVCVLGRTSPGVEEPTAGVGSHGNSPEPTVIGQRSEASGCHALMVPRLTWAQVAYPHPHQMTSPTRVIPPAPLYPLIHK